MPAQRKPRLLQLRLPAAARADLRRIIEQSMLLFLGRQSGETGMQRMVGREECLLPVQDGRVGRAAVFEALDLAGAERELDAAQKRRVGIGLEVGIDQIRDLAGMSVELD